MREAIKTMQRLAQEMGEELVGGPVPMLGQPHPLFIDTKISIEDGDQMELFVANENAQGEDQ